VTGQLDVGIASRVMNLVPVRLAFPSIAWQFRLFEPELGRLDELVPRDRGAVDVGVWWGPWTWWLARRVPRVDSFEPNSDLVARLAPVMPDNVTLHPVALSDRSGEAEFWVPSGGTGTEGRASLEHAGRSGRGWRHHPVVTRRLDDFALDDVGFVKIDVEGHEFAVLHGAAGLIDRERPTVLVEIELRPERSGQIDEIIGFFDDHAYRGEFLHQGRWRPIGELNRWSTEVMATRAAQHGYVTNLLLFSRRYIHNFVFRPV